MLSAKRKCAGGIVFFKNKVALVKAKGRWGLPKGRVEKGKTYANTAVKEVHEECGLQVTVGRRLGVTETKSVKTVYFAMNLFGDSALMVDKKEIRKAQWVSLKVARKRLTKPQFKLVTKALAKGEAI